MGIWAVIQLGHDHHYCKMYHEDLSYRKKKTYHQKRDTLPNTCLSFKANYLNRLFPDE